MRTHLYRTIGDNGEAKTLCGRNVWRVNSERLRFRLRDAPAGYYCASCEKSHSRPVKPREWLG